MSANNSKSSSQQPSSNPPPHWWRMETMAYRSGNHQTQMNSAAPSDSMKSAPVIGSSGSHTAGGGVASARSLSGTGHNTTPDSPVKSEPVIYAVAVESTQLDMLKQRRMSVLQGVARPNVGGGVPTGRSGVPGGGITPPAPHSTLAGGFKILKLSQPAIQSLAHVHQSSSRPSQTGLAVDPSSPLPGTNTGGEEDVMAGYRRLSTTIAGASAGSRRTSTSELLFSAGLPMSNNANNANNNSTLLTPGSNRNYSNTSQYNNNNGPLHTFQQPSVSSFHFPNDEALTSCENSMTSASYHNSHYEPPVAGGGGGGGGGGAFGSTSRPHSTRSNSYHHSAMPMPSATYSGGNNSGLLHNNSSGGFPNMANLSLCSSPAGGGGGGGGGGPRHAAASNSTSGTLGRASSVQPDTPSSSRGGGKGTSLTARSGMGTPHLGGGGGGLGDDSSGGGGGSPASPLPFHYLSPEHLSSRGKGGGTRRLGDSSGGLMTNTNFFGESDKKSGRPHSPLDSTGREDHLSNSTRGSKYQGNSFFRRERAPGSSMGSLHSAKDTSSLHSSTHHHHSSVNSSHQSSEQPHSTHNHNNNNNNNNNSGHNRHPLSTNPNFSDIKGGKPSKTFGEMSRRLDMRKNPTKKDG